MAIARTKWGLHVEPADLYLDARRRAPGLVFVSHAHSDHCSTAARVVCTRETAALHRRVRGPRDFLTLDYGERLALGPCILELTPAGHTLGSAMAIVDTPAGRVVYTGDYKLRPGAFSSGVPVPRCDTLVMECTFGHPRYRFPAEQDILGRLYAFIDGTRKSGAVPVVLAYAFGKTQEALYHLTGRGYHVAVAEPGAGLCAEHALLGYTFPAPGGWSTYTPACRDFDVLLMTSRGRKALRGTGLRYRFVHLTGWACGGQPRLFGADLALPLSGHADFDELVRTARDSGASKVYTVHGSPRFAAHLRSLGITAEHLDGSGAGQAKTNGAGRARNPGIAVTQSPRALEAGMPRTEQLGLDLG